MICYAVVKSCLQDIWTKVPSSEVGSVLIGIVLPLEASKLYFLRRPSLRHSMIRLIQSKPDQFGSLCLAFLFYFWRLKQKQKYRGMFETQKSGNKTSSGDIGLNIRTLASPQVGQGQVSGGVSVPCRHATPVADARWKPIFSYNVKVGKKSSQGKVS